MMDLIGNFKVAFVTGPPFSGKTYFVSSILPIIDNCKVVSYELFFNNGGYKAFYAEVLRLALAGHYVIAESANNYSGHSSEYNNPGFEDNNVSCLHIGMFPDINAHHNNVARFRKQAGYEAVSGRLGGFSLEKLRKIVKFAKGSKTHFCDGVNIQAIKEVVLSHAANNEENNYK